MKTLRYEYDPVTDIMEIEGVKYTAELFRLLGGGMETGRWFRIMSRHDGALEIQAAQPGARLGNDEPEPQGREV